MFNFEVCAYLFEIKEGENLRLCTRTGWIQICSGIENPTAIFIIIKASGIKIPYSWFIVKTGFWADPLDNMSYFHSP